MSSGEIFLAAILLGLTAGISPGPLILLTVSETLKYGRNAGLKVALSPLITDIPIIFISFYLIKYLKDYEPLLGIISICGGLFVLFLASETFFPGKRLLSETTTEKSHSLKKGISVNFLNPHPYLFWLTVGSSYILKAKVNGIFTIAGFLTLFYACLISSKVIVVIITLKTRHFMESSAYKMIIRLIGIMLVILATVLMKEGLQYLHIIRQ
jgi:threonine/homoserine/homoserine lactone efflux protein